MLLLFAGTCLVKRDPGMCSDYVILWYYDTASQSCRRFWYGGCEGNDNRFDDKEDCENYCIHGKHTTTRPTTTTTRRITTPKLPDTTTNLGEFSFTFVVYMYAS